VQSQGHLLLLLLLLMTFIRSKSKKMQQQWHVSECKQEALVYISGLHFQVFKVQVPLPI